MEEQFDDSIRLKNVELVEVVEGRLSLGGWQELEEREVPKSGSDRRSRAPRFTEVAAVPLSCLRWTSATTCSAYAESE